LCAYVGWWWLCRITTPPGASQGPGWLRVLDAVLPPSADAPSTSRITTWNGTVRRRLHIDKWFQAWVVVYESQGKHTRVHLLSTFLRGSLCAMRRCGVDEW